MYLSSYRNNGVIVSTAGISLLILCFRELFTSIENVFTRRYYKIENCYIFDTVALICFVITAVLCRRMIVRDIKRGKGIVLESSWFINIMLIYNCIFVLMYPRILDHFYTIHRQILREKNIFKILLNLVLVYVRVFNEEIVFRWFLYHVAKTHVRIKKCVIYKKWWCMLAVLAIMFFNALIHALIRVMSSPFVLFPYDLLYHIIFNLTLLSISEAYNSLMATFFINLFNECWMIISWRIFFTNCAM